MKSPIMKADEGGNIVLVELEWAEERNESQSQDQNRPVFDKILRAYISAPNAKNQVATHIIERHFWAPEGEERRVKVNEELKARFHRQIEAWNANNAEELSGTPLRELSGLDVAQVAELKAQGIHTVEALAGVSDGNLGMGMRHWRDMAKTYMDKASGDAPLSKLTAENADLKDQVEQLTQQLAALQETLEADPPKRGRKAA